MAGEEKKCTVFNVQGLLNNSCQGVSCCSFDIVTFANLHFSFCIYVNDVLSYHKTLIKLAKKRETPWGRAQLTRDSLSVISAK